MQPKFFATPAELRKWFEPNHIEETELLMGFHKVGSGKPSITWSESVDEALCFGWIDGVRKSIDENSYTIRFTPRKPKSNWSAVNIRKVEELTKKGLMKPAGMAAFEKREEARSRIYSFEQENIAGDKDFEKQIRANKTAWEYFRSTAPSYQKACTWWVMSAKQEATKQKRLETLISDSEKGVYVKQFISPGKQKKLLPLK